MANDNSMQIVLEMIDKASPEFKRVNQEIIREVNQMAGSTNQAFNKSQDAVDKLSESMKFYKLQTETTGDSIGLVRSQLSTFNRAIAEGVKLTDEQTVHYEQLKLKLKELGAEGEKSGQKVSNSFQEASKSLQAFRRTMFIVTAAVAVGIKGVNDLAQYNEEARKTMDGFTKSLKTLSTTIGTIFEPALKGITAVIHAFQTTIEAAMGGFVKLFAFVFEFLAQLPSAFQNILANVKSVFTGDDPIGIVEGFQRSFDRALEVANIAADQLLTKMEETNIAIATGRTLDNTKEQEVELYQRAEEGKKQAAKKTSDTEKQLKAQAVTDTKSMLSQLASHNKAAAVAYQVVSIAEAIMNTAKGVTKALSMANIPLAAVIGALGAAQVATIASQKFHDGGMIKGNGLQNGEVPIIAQTGEGVISRRGMANIGESGLNAINRGGFAGGVSAINIYIQTAVMDTAKGISSTAEMLGLEIENSLRRSRSF